MKLTVGDVLAHKHPTPRPVYWVGEVPPACQLTGRAFGGIMYDANLRGIGWGCFNEATFREMGGRLGTGSGQRYEKQPDGRWLKVGG